MVSLENAVIARLRKAHHTFEIYVDPHAAWEFRQGKPVSLDRVLAVSEVFVDAKKGDRAADADLAKAFSTTDRTAIATQILKTGEIQFTTEQRRMLLAQKHKEVADIISRQGVNPQTGLPHPPARILHAMEEAHVSLDPFTPAHQQVEAVLDKIRPVIPIRIERMEVAVKIPVQHAGRAAAALRSLGPVKKEEWTAEAYYAVIEIPAGRQSEVYSTLNELTGGHAEVKKIEKK